MRIPRWMVERKLVNVDREQLQIVEVYAEKEIKETVKKENKHWSHKRKLILVEGR